MRPPRVPRSPLFAIPSLPVFLATLTAMVVIVWFHWSRLPFPE